MKVVVSKSPRLRVMFVFLVCLDRNALINEKKEDYATVSEADGAIRNVTAQTVSVLILSEFNDRSNGLEFFTGYIKIFR